MIDSGSWLTNRNREKRCPSTMRILRDFVVFAETSRMFVSSPTTSSLILKSIRQRLIEVCATTRAINQIHLPRGLKFAIGSTDFVDRSE